MIGTESGVLPFEKLQQRIVVMNGRTEIALLRKGDLVLELVEPAGRIYSCAKEVAGTGKDRERKAGFHGTGNIPL